MSDRNTTAVRLKDVAALAGVSTATVSRVIHSNGYVSEEVRERVLDAIQQSGYRLNAVAQGLRRQRTMTFGHILQGVLPNPFFLEVAMGVEQAAAEAGFNVLMFNARDDASREREGVETLLARRVDAIIFTTAVSEDNVRLAVDAGSPVVEVERQLCEGTASVMVDNYAGARQAMQHLVQLGHRAIGYIGTAFTLLRGASDQRTDRIVMERFSAYRDVLHQVGAPPDDNQVVLGDYAKDPGWSDLRTGADYMRGLLKQAPGITAVFAESDLLAAGALQALYELGIRVPDQMSVVGFDDTFAKHLAPPLTTVRQPMLEMGLKATGLALRLLSDGISPVAPTEWCSTSLVVRGSTSANRGCSTAAAIAQPD